MVTRIASSNRTRFRPQAEPTEAELTALRATVLTQAAVDAFGAATLADAQVILGTAVPSLTTSITFSVPFIDVTSAAPALSASPVVTVPMGNPGKIQATGAGGSYSINGAPFASLGPGGIVLTLVSADILQFRRALAGISIISVYDSTTGAQINDDFALEAS